MSMYRTDAHVDPVPGGVGRCVCCFWLAVTFDLVGLLVLLVGVFCDIIIYDLLIYAGALVLFLSLIWWICWFSGNIEVPAEPEEPEGSSKKRFGRALRRVSASLTRSFRRSGAPEQVVVAMATVTPRDDPDPSAAADVRNPKTTGEKPGGLCVSGSVRVRSRGTT